MNQALQLKIESAQFRKDNAKFNVGDSVKVHTKVVEGDKERIQVFEGTVIGKSKTGIQECFRVRRMSYGVGVERVFPMHSPFIEKVQVSKRGIASRAKLYYLRDKSGKDSRIQEERRVIEEQRTATVVPAPVEQPKEAAAAPAAAAEAKK